MRLTHRFRGGIIQIGVAGGVNDFGHFSPEALPVKDG